MTAIIPASDLGALLRSMGGASCDLIGQILAAAQNHLDANLSFLAEFQGDLKVIRRVVSDGSPALLAEGQCLPLQATYCYRVVRGELPNAICDAHADLRVSALPITEQLDIGAYVGVPVLLPDGRVFGTLCCVKTRADPTLDQRDVKFMRVLGDLIGVQLARDAAATEDRRQKTTRIQAWIETGPRMVFQPIIELESGRIVGVESLARFDADPARTPDRWFAEAWEVGLGVELELAAVRAAIADPGPLPEGAYLTVNASPATLLSQAFSDAVQGIAPEQLVVEVTEHAVVEAYEPLIEAVERLAERGIRLAVDDAGAGYSGLCHILRVAPRLVKLDLMLTRGIHDDPVKQALVTAVVGFASHMRIDLVAEGIETREDAAALRRLGVPFGQGFYLGEPGPLPMALRRTDRNRDPDRRPSVH